MPRDHPDSYPLLGTSSPISLDNPFRATTTNVKANLSTHYQYLESATTKAYSLKAPRKMAHENDYQRHVVRGTRTESQEEVIVSFC
jgi:hypothetical protein